MEDIDGGLFLKNFLLVNIVYEALENGCWYMTNRYKV